MSMDRITLPRILVSEVGSRMWGMETISSDHDIVMVYKYPTKLLLSGHRVRATMPSRSDGLYDRSYMEVGHILGLVAKGNINALWALTSPIVEYEHELMYDIRKFINDHRLDVTPSCIGMAISQWSDSTKRANMRDPIKSKCTAMRTLRFGLTYLGTHRIEYNPVEIRDYTHEELIDVVQCVKYNRHFTDRGVVAGELEKLIYNIRTTEVVDNDGVTDK